MTEPEFDSPEWVHDHNRDTIAWVGPTYRLPDDPYAIYDPTSAVHFGRRRVLAVICARCTPEDFRDRTESHVRPVVIGSDRLCDICQTQLTKGYPDTKNPRYWWIV